MDLSRALEEKEGAKKTLRGILNKYIEQISTWIEDGYSKKQIFEVLEEKEIISCKYDHFIKTIRKLQNEFKDKNNDDSNTPISNRPSSKKKFEMLEIDDNEIR